MNTFSKPAQGMSVIGALLILAVFCFGCRNAQTKNNNFPTPKAEKSKDEKKWIPSGYSGIEIGMSTRDDVIKKFGNPVWEGEEELEGEEEDVQKALAERSGKRILLEYKNVGDMQGKTSVLIGKKDKIVQAIVLYPTMPFAKEALTSKYGNDFVELNSNEPTCSAVESPVQKVSTKKNESS